MQICVIFGHQGLPNTGISIPYQRSTDHENILHLNQAAEAVITTNQTFFGTPCTMNANAEYKSMHNAMQEHTAR